MYKEQPSRAERGVSTAGAVAIAVPMILMFMHLGDVDVRTVFSPRTQLINIADLPPPPPPPPVAATRTVVPIKAPGAPAKKAVATEVVAPPPKVVIPTFQPIVAAPAANIGVSAKSGAAATRDTAGTGAAGAGNGVGSGIDRSADPVMLRGVTYADYPMDLQALWPSGTKVVTRLTVGTNGKVKDCEVIEGVGNRSVDRQTCRLLKFKGRFKPATNAKGQPVQADFTYGVVGLRPPEPAVSRRR